MKLKTAWFQHSYSFQGNVVDQNVMYWVSQVSVTLVWTIPQHEVCFSNDVLMRK